MLRNVIYETMATGKAGITNEVLVHTIVMNVMDYDGLQLANEINHNIKRFSISRTPSIT